MGLVLLESGDGGIGSEGVPDSDGGPGEQDLVGGDKPITVLEDGVGITIGVGNQSGSTVLEDGVGITIGVGK